MICGYCGLTFDEKEGKRGCGGCSGGCHSIHCPRCNYKNPLEAGIVTRLKKVFGRNEPDKGDIR